MTCEIRTCYLLLASYYIVAVYANMPDLKTMKSKIEVEIEVQKIKNNIIQKLRNKGAQIGDPRVKANGKSRDPMGSRIIAGSPPDRNPTLAGGLLATLAEGGASLPNGRPPKSQPKSKPLIVIGEPRSKRQTDKCLNFRFGKYMKPNRIEPIRLNLWIYLRVQRNRKKKKGDQSVDKLSNEKRNSVPKNPLNQRKARRQIKKKKNRRRKDKKKNKRKNRKNRKGRKVKIVVSDEKKRLVIMRMRVKMTDWYMLELPISQFPAEISQNYTRTLCIKCKRCNKKIEIDLRSKRLLGDPRSGDPTVPFIHIEKHQSLPQPPFRNVKRRRRSEPPPRAREHAGVPAPCCREDIHTIHIAKDFPSILHPYSFNISLCTHLSRDHPLGDTTIPLLSQQNNSISNHISLRAPPSRTVLCDVTSMEPLTVTYIDTLFNVKQMTIDNVIPTGCVCKFNRG